MKNNLLILLVLFSFSGISQPPKTVVLTPKTDAILKAEASVNKERFIDRMKLAIRDSELLLKAREAVEMVSNAVLTSVQVKRLTEHQQECYKTIEWVINDIDVNDYANTIVEDSATEIIDLTLELEDNIASTTAILTSKFFDMEDGERLRFVRELNSDVTEIENKLYRLKRKNKRYNDLYRYYNEMAKNK